MIYNDLITHQFLLYIYIYICIKILIKMYCLVDAKCGNKYNKVLKIDINDSQIVYFVHVLVRSSHILNSLPTRNKTTIKHNPQE